ncbi:collagen alpha-2(VIII) chain-like [Mercenaria mercenaria]|uniref:collagen alpha-2(VIII) chain-like n=1 Tax=Mercenaria mercenaria TaxID=6596 RepID=UPI00234EA0F0|nr:collagen alpha-2(VIII) chain-like [Mercenaria mercenaria]
MLKLFLGLGSLVILTCSTELKDDDLDIREMAQQIKALQTEVKDLKQRVKVYEKSAGRPRSKKYLLSDNLEMGPVAFSAYISNYQNGLAPHKTLTFDSAILNDGKGYNNHTGIFTTPVSGVYLVSFFIADRDVNQVFVQLTVDNTIVSTACAETIQNRHIDQGGNVVLVRLTKGQNMWVEVTTGNAHIESHTAYRFTSFSAVLLYEV